VTAFVALPKMSCTTRNARLLSEAMDGRLPSRRREKILEHLGSCASCRATWDGMHAARNTLFRLPGERVGNDFAQGLWQRIEAGEGTPEHALDAPIPWPSKVRYLATGAAAAAAVLIVFSSVFSGLGGSTSRPNGGTTNQGVDERSVARADEVLSGVDPRSAAAAGVDPRSVAAAGVDPRSVAAAGVDPRSVAAAITPRDYGGEPLRPRGQGGDTSVAGFGSPSLDSLFAGRSVPASDLGSRFGDLEARPVEPMTLARTVNAELRTAAQRLVRRARDLSTTRPNPRIVAELRQRTDDAAATAVTLRWLADQGHVDLPQTTREVLGQLIGLRDRAARADISSALDLLREAARVDADRLEMQFSVRCCPDPETFQNQLIQHVMQNPSAQRVLPLQVFPGCELPGAPTNTRILILHSRVHTRER
jgi:hypothetical protein